MKKKPEKKKPKEINWDRMGDPKYVAKVLGGKVATDEEMYDLFFADEPNFGDNALIAHHKKVFKKCVDISRAKCQDYAGDSDPLANFRMCQQFGVDTEHGIMVRLSDKISRIGRLLNKENTVLDEKIEDTILDGINYLSTLYFALLEKRGEKDGE